jgi:hypothetical protein
MGEGGVNIFAHIQQELYEKYVDAIIAKPESEISTTTN